MNTITSVAYFLTWLCLFARSLRLDAFHFGFSVYESLDSRKFWSILHSECFVSDDDDDDDSHWTAMRNRKTTFSAFCVLFFVACISQRVSLHFFSLSFSFECSFNYIPPQISYDAFAYSEAYMLFVCYSMINIQCSHRICIKKIPLNRMLAENKTFIQRNTYKHTRAVIQ